MPFQGGGAAGVQLAGGHIDGNTNNPNENAGQWKGGNVKPLCVFSPTRLPASGKVTATMGWSDIPTCKEAGIPIDQFQMPRTVWLPGGVSPDAVAFYADLLKKVSETPEWKEYIERTSQTARFLTGEELKSFIADDNAKNQKVFEKEGWIVQLGRSRPRPAWRCAAPARQPQEGRLPCCLVAPRRSARRPSRPLWG